MAEATKRRKQRRAQAFDVKRCVRTIKLFASRGCGYREIHKHVGSRPLVLGEDALLQPVTAHQFGVGERDARVAWCSDACAVGGEGAFCKVHT
jgi:hypothetical protein